MRHPHKRTGRLTRKQRRRLARERQRRWELENARVRAQIAAIVEATRVPSPAGIGLFDVLALGIVLTLAASALIAWGRCG